MVEAIETPKSESKKKQKVDWENTAFVVYDGAKLVKAYRLRNESQYKELLKYAKDNGYGIKKGTVTKNDDGKFFTSPPYVIDWNCIVEDAESKQSEKSSKKPKKSEANELLEQVYQKLEEARENDASIKAEEIKDMISDVITSMSAFTIRMSNFLKSKPNREMERAGSKKHPVYRLKKINDDEP